MKRWLMLIIALLALTAPAGAQGTSLVYGPADGHSFIEVSTFELDLPIAFTLAVDGFKVPADDPALVSDPDASLIAVEAGPYLTLGNLRLGAGVRHASASLDGTVQAEVEQTYWTDATGREVSYEAAHNGLGELEDDYQEHTRTVTVTAPVRLASTSTTELAGLIFFSQPVGPVSLSAQASYAASGFAYRVGVGYQPGEDLTLGLGWRSLPVEDGYNGPVLMLGARF